MTRYLAPGDPGTRIYFGRPGSGKTYAARSEALAGADRRPTIVLDLNGDWFAPRGSDKKRPTYKGWIWKDGIGMPPTLDAWLRGNKHRRIVVTSNADRALSSMAFGHVAILQATVSETTRAVERAVNKPGCAIVITELHLYTPHRVAPPWLIEIATRWRHKDLAVYSDTQRVADVPRRVTELSTEIWLGNVTGPRDRAAVYGLATDVDQLALAHRKVCARAAAGEKGIHVRLDEGFAPPYEVIGGGRG